MQESDLDFAAACTQAEGWVSETRQVFEGFHAHDPDGCFVVEEGSRQIGIGVATSYGRDGFVGELIVLPEWRGRGVGRALLDNAVTYLRDRGAENIYLDGVQKAVSLYERAGFRKVCSSLRFAGHLAGESHPGVRAMILEDLEAVCHLDQEAFGSDRGFFLKLHLTAHPELCKVLVHDVQVAGFIMGRRVPGMIAAGPWIVAKQVERPADLLESLALEADGLEIGLGVLETNCRAVQAIRSLGLTERPSPPWRMVLGRSERLGAAASCFAVGAPAKG